MKLTDEQERAIHAIADEEGRLTPAQVVEAAKSKASPLHSLFEWDKGKAAYQHWLNVARDVIGAVKIAVTINQAIIRAPHFVHDPDAPGQGYRSTVMLRKDLISARQSLIYTLEVAAGHVKRGYDLAAQLGLEGEVDALIERIAGLQRVLKSEAA